MLIPLQLPSSCRHQKSIFNFYAARTALANNAYLSGGEEASTVYPLALMIVAGAFMGNFVVGFPVEVAFPDLWLD